MKRWILISLTILAFNSIVEAKVLLVPSPWYPTIQRAINSAVAGDTIIISPGTYRTAGGYFIYNNITIKGSNPNDPNVVAATVILKEVGEGGSGGGSIFHIYSPSTLDGLTLTTNGGEFHGRDQDPNTGPGGKGDDGGEDWGGIIDCCSSSPTIKNCVISNSHIRGGHGGTGGNGGATPDPNVPDKPNGGKGGEPGFAYGGGLACWGSSPVVTNCSFIDCSVRGGNGGDGGDGVTIEGVDDGKGGRPGGIDFPDLTGFGGAVYISASSYPKFTNCKFINNRAFGGIAGISGLDAEPPERPPPNIHYKIDTLGGSVYCAAGGSAKFENCLFTGNIADNNSVDGEDSFVSFGGAVAAEWDPSTAIIFNNCTFKDNSSTVGGALFWHDTSADKSPLIDSCNFSGNSAIHGGGVFYFTSSPKIARSNFSWNIANGPSGEAGQGGGLYCFDTDAQISDCDISNNTSLGSGGGIYIASWYRPILLKNCLIAHNTANRDGGGVSLDWSSNPAQIKNCTIANNTVTGNGFPAGYGGGLYTSYESSATLTNSTVWGNTAPYGNQIAVGTYAGVPSNVTARYSDVQGGATGVFIDSGSTLSWEAGNLAGVDAVLNPLFVSGYGGNYYLSQTAAGQSPPNSPCVDKGSSTALGAGLYRHTTRTDRRPEQLSSIVDIGYHFLLTADVVGDFTFDGIVDFNDLAILLSHNGETDCAFPEWCNGTDLNFDGKVDGNDFSIFAHNYKVSDHTAPVPNPMTWAVPPQAAGLTSTTMTATTAYDNSSVYFVEYYFEETSGNAGGSSGGWQSSPIYTDTGLTTGTQYSYRVKARDARHNETGWSFVGYAVAQVPPDTTPPSPNPPTWKKEPYGTSTHSIAMEANPASDPCGVEYYFEFVQYIPDPVVMGSSGWQSGTVWEFSSEGLDPDAYYCCFRFKARDKSPNHNETNWSSELIGHTLAEDGEPNNPPPSNDTTPPEPNPSEWAVNPVRNNDSNEVYMEAVTASDATTGGNDPVWYYFDCTSGGCPDSGWRSSPIYTFKYPSHCVFRVRTKDNVGNTGQYSESWYTGW